jgi:hypothetical protein
MKEKKSKMSERMSFFRFAICSDAEEILETEKETGSGLFNPYTYYQHGKTCNYMGNEYDFKDYKKARQEMGTQCYETLIAFAINFIVTVLLLLIMVPILFDFYTNDGVFAALVALAIFLVMSNLCLGCVFISSLYKTIDMWDYIEEKGLNKKGDVE